ncbi:hypothetical protein E4T48_01762 [Aureobasidium sp. EXF-10727]|nr:hypothetical protein E4T48_01762 [Aureobasidium sp. EXF-10727]
MTDAVSSRASPTFVANKRRRLDAPYTAREASTHVQFPDERVLKESTRPASLHNTPNRLPDETYDPPARRESTQPAPLRNTPSRQPSRASSPSEQDASLVLVGTKGSGLSSFGVIAATALRFRLVDTESWLVEHCGMRRSEYVKTRGLSAYRNVASRALEDILKQHASRCVIVCGPEALEPHCQALIRTFALTHPVVMINRDLTMIRDYLALPDTQEVLQILGRSRQLCRRISNYEFYNIPETEAKTPLSAELCRNLRRPTETHNPPQLLQNVKQDFLHFLHLLARTPVRADSLLCSVSPTEREYSTLSVLPSEHVASGSFSLVNLDCGTDAIELVVRCCSTQRPSYDRDRISRSLQMIRRQSNSPILYHVECEDPTKEEYYDLVSHGLRLVPDFVTIDLGCTDHQIHDLLRSVGRTKIVGHRSYSSDVSSPWKDPALHKEFDRAVSLGCHVVRFVRRAVSASEDRDCVLFQAAIASRSNVPLVAYTTGIQSKSSMVLNSCLTPIQRPDILDPSPATSFLTLQQLMKAKFSTYIYQPLHFHIFGASVDYSVSPLMHNAAFEALAMDHTYSIRQSSDLRNFACLVDDSFGGSSISLPFKSEILPLLNSISEAAKAIQAVNTIIPLRAAQDTSDADLKSFCRSHKNRAGPVVGLHGENTDWTALYTCVSRYLSPANTVQPSSSALVIGAGGMGRASVYALLQMGVKNIVMWNRTHGKAVQVAEHFTKLSMEPRSRLPSGRIEVVESLDSPWPEDLAQPTIVVCTIPAHQIGDTPPPEFVIPQQWFQSRTGGVIVEQAHDRAHKGWICVEPLEMLIEQGCAQFELFTGYPAPQKAMKDGIMERYVAMHVAQKDG